MLDENKGLYTIGTVAELIDEHPETLRIWERNDLIRPDRNGYQRRYSNNDLKRLRFIQYLMDAEGLNIAGVRALLSLYACWYLPFCKGGAAPSGDAEINEKKHCWKTEGCFCLAPSDKAEYCSNCACAHCNRCNRSE